MKENETGLIVVNIDELAQRWQIPVERVQYFITDCGMDMNAPEKWAAANSDIILREKQAAFEANLFPIQSRGEKSESIPLPTAISANVS